jgi:NAD(P)-dependent dehydrogenase (short-subunit alcohol dehydrogenase family)
MADFLNLRDRVVVVTGAASGMGRAIARAAAGEGARLVLSDLDADRLKTTAAELAGPVRHLRADVTSVPEIDAVFALAEREFGQIDGLVTCAGIITTRPLLEVTPEEWDRAFAVNAKGTFFTVQAALRRMLPRDRGVIVQVGSALSRRGIPLQASYCGAKHAVKGFLDSLRTELLHRGSNVRVALVQLPGVNTPQFDWVRTRLRRHPQPVPPIYQPEVAARAIVWAAEHPRRELWVGLPTVYTILGEKFVSGLMDRYLARTNIKAQQMPDQPIDPAQRRDNLTGPPRGDPGVHGEFDGKAHPRSPQLWMTTHKRAFAGGAAVGSVAIAAVLRRLTA